LGLDAFRLFISYRWDDCETFAGQLFDRLARERFDVYLDRFRTDPGANFLDRIRAELADKACVVLLDSRDVGRSSWVAGEYAFARLYRLGLMAIDLPGGQRTFPRIGTRLDLRRSKRPATFSASTPLPVAALERAVAFIRANYSVEVSRRFRHQRRLVRTSAALAGVSSSERSDGLIEVTGAHGYILGASARPPGVEHFRLVCQAAAGNIPPAKGIVIGPLFAQMHQAREDVRWLAQETGSAAIDERRLLKAMRRVARGSL
jgi:hypothetical protein